MIIYHNDCRIRILFIVEIFCFKIFLPYILRTLKEAGYLDWIKFMYEDMYFKEIFDSKLNI